VSTWEEAVTWLRGQPEQQDLVRWCFFDDPLSEAAQRYYASTEWRAVRALLPARPGTALDVGAGRGIASYALARDGWQVWALEPDPSDLVGAGAIRALARETGWTSASRRSAANPCRSPTGRSICCTAARCCTTRATWRSSAGGRARARAGWQLRLHREHVISKQEDLAAFLAAHPLHRLYGGERAYLLGDYRRALAGSGLVLSAVLNPYQSDINLYPETRRGLKRRIAGRLRLPGALLPQALLDLLGSRSDTPGGCTRSSAEACLGRRWSPAPAGSSAATSRASWPAPAGTCPVSGTAPGCAGSGGGGASRNGALRTSRWRPWSRTAADPT